MWYQVDCDRCSYSQRVSDKPYYYQFPDGNMIFISTDWAWCVACACLVVVESVPTLEETIKDYQENLKDPLPELLAIPGYLEEWEGWLKDRTLKDSLRRIEWRKTRRAPAHCLACGGTDFLTFVISRATGNYDSIEHPHCGGNLSLGNIGFTIPAVVYIYSPEGDFLEERTR